MFEDICKKYNHYFSREYSIYHKDYPWLEDILEIADDEFVSYYERDIAVPESAIKYGLKKLRDDLKVNNYKNCIAQAKMLYT